ncbi:MAG: hypothetical protein M5U34_08230 [Chloroflexi bacterium]|nr:hypothetical protein [Chloroflexota bacterium]
MLRPGAFYGPWGRYAFNRLFFEEPLRGWRIKVNGGRHITFPVYALDVVQSIMLALVNGRSGQVYNICSQSLDHNSVNNIISDLAGISRWRFNFPTWSVLALAKSWTALSRYTGREPFYPINMAPYVFQDWPISTQKAETELGFQPTPFTSGAAATLDWYRQQGYCKGGKVAGGGLRIVDCGLRIVDCGLQVAGGERQVAGGWWLAAGGWWRVAKWQVAKWQVAKWQVAGGWRRVASGWRQSISLLSNLPTLQPTIRNPQSPIPNPQSPIRSFP